MIYYNYSKGQELIRMREVIILVCDADGNVRREKVLLSK